jgi:3-dehydroquinate synthase
MTADANLVLCGFMGTGKTTVGPLLAAALGDRFVDADEVLAARFGKPIANVFAEEGEAAFRAAERDLCQHVEALGARVVAVGGGAVADPTNLDALARWGQLICLTASSGELERRLAASDSRPLLAHPRGSLAERIRQLLDVRRSAYARVPWQIETTFLAPAQVCARVLASLGLRPDVQGMARLVVAVEQRPYDVCVGEGLLARAGDLLDECAPRDGAVAIVANPAVGALYGGALATALTKRGYRVASCEVPDGEQHKTLATVGALFSKLAEAGLDRQGTVVALGGGVTGDMAGFAAATYLRGVRVVQIPTSLLGMVDASVGGKTGVDLPEGKNLVGAFKHPALVLADALALQTLPTAEVRSGMSEVIKHAIIAAPHLFARLEQGPGALSWQTLAEAIRVKVDVVNEDPFENGRRAVLNLGHTFGHAFERVTGYAIGHGVAVGVGLVAAAQLGVELSLCDAAVKSRIAALVARWGLPIKLEGMDAHRVRAAMCTDKKRINDALRFVVPEDIGRVTVVKAPDERAVRRAIQSVLG